MHDRVDDIVLTMPNMLTEERPATGAERFRTMLLDQAGLSPATVARAEHAAAETGTRLPATLVNLGFLSDTATADLLAAAYDAPRVGADDWPQEPVAADRLPPRFLTRHKLLPLALKDGTLDLAVADPGHGFSVRAVELAVGVPARLHVATAAEIDATIHRIYEADRGDEHDDLERRPDDVMGDVETLRDMASDAPVVRLVNQLFNQAVERGASDIHIESTATGLRVRLRIHGRLVEIESPPAQLKPAILSRIKLLAGMDIAEYRLPQDGRIKTIVRGRTIDMRVASLPTPSGETIVIRVLDRAAVKFDFATLGMDPDSIDRLRRMVRQDTGIVLVTGPTGSGKTTTLYTAVQDINESSLKIITVEDPIEYQFEGVVQIQVKSEIGLDFASVLRATLRHNPDVLLVGEIRDRETAQVAIQASLTGHLVLSTLHTNSAAATVTRLVDMGIDPFLVAATLTGVVSQRLVPTLCPHCRVPDPASTAAVRAMAPTLPEPIQAHRPGGCDQCDQTGYVGRTVIQEIIEITPALRDAIGRGEFDRLEALAPDFKPIQTAALEKVARGQVSLGDALRATQL